MASNRSLSQFSASKAPDLSDVGRLSTQLGRDTAYSSFAEMILKQREAQRKKDEAERKKAEKATAKAEKDAAAEALAEEPESKSFWEKLGQSSLEGISWAIDKASRLEFGVTSAVDFVYNKEDDEDESKNFWKKLSHDVLLGPKSTDVANPFLGGAKISDSGFNITDTGDLFKAFGQGVAGKKGHKKYFSEIIKEQAQKDPGKNFFDNKWYQGLTGFGLDVVMDPLTYVGPGLVTKPLKKATAKAVDDTLVEDLGKLGLKVPDESTGELVDLTANEFRSILGRGDRDRMIVPKFGANGERLTRRERNAYVKANTIKGRFKVSKSDEVAKVRTRLDNLEKVRKAIKADPDIPDASSALKQLIEDTEVQLKNVTEKYGTDSYKRALRKFDKDIATGVSERLAAEAPKSVTIDKHMDSFIDREILARGIKARRLAKGHKNDAAKKAQFGTRNQRQMDAAFAFEGSARHSEKFKKNHEALLAAEVKHNEAYQKLSEEAGKLTRPIKQLEADLAKEGNKGNKELEDKLIQYKNKQSKLYDERDHVEAGVLHNMIARDANVLAMSRHPKYIDEYNAINERLSRVTRAMTDISFRKTGLEKHSSVVSSKANPAVGSELKGAVEEGVDSKTAEGFNGQKLKFTQDEMNDLVTERRELESRLDGLESKFTSEFPEESFFNSAVSERPVLAKPGENATELEKNKWNTNVELYVKKRTEQLYKQRISTERRKKRKDAGRIPSEHAVFMGGKSDGVLRVHSKHDYDKVLSIAENRKELEEMATTRDMRAFNAKTNTDPKTPLAKIVFDREFKKQYGFTTEEVHRTLTKKKGRVITYGNFGEFTKREFLDAVRKEPLKYARSGSGISVPRIYLEGSEGFPSARVSFTSMRTKNNWVKWVAEHGGDKVQAQRSWDKGFAAYIKDPKRELEVIRIIGGRWDAFFNEAKNKAKGISSEISTDKTSLTTGERKSALHWAEEQAKKEVELKKSIPNLMDMTAVHHYGPHEIAPDAVTVEELHKAALASERETYAQAIRDAKLANPTKRSPVGVVASKLATLKEQHEAATAAYEKAFKESVAAREVMKQRLDESVDLNALEEIGSQGALKLRIKAGGLKLMDVPVPEALTNATEKLSGIGIVQAMNKKWAAAFHPASKLEPEINLARLRAQSRSDDIIKHHVLDLRKKFSKYKPEQRKVSMNLLRRGVDPTDDLGNELKEFFVDFTKYVDGRTIIGSAEDGTAEALTALDLNRFLPHDMEFIHPKGKHVNGLDLSTGENIVKAMKNLDPKVDPLEVMWHLRIAAEKAMAYKALQHAIKTTFGVKRIIRTGRKADLEPPSDRELLIENMHEEHGWIENKDIGSDYYFPREVSEQITKLSKMMHPRETEGILKTYDKVLNFWKAAVTIYNPGYYTRNGIGEMMMGMFDGVTNPRSYQKASQVMSTFMPDSTKEALKELEPWVKHETQREQGKKVLVTLRSAGRGKKPVQLTREDVWVLYNDVGLKSGFISSEFDHYFPAANKIRATAVGQVATKANDALRLAGEKYEDYFRMAHFISRLERSNASNALEAAEDAATHVRKWHFDYTDFTPFEKGVMMRVFPFYKWTRKSMPIMASMLFTQPGKVMLYPKAMTGLSVGTGGTDPMKDNNGFAPNYEELTPAWMKAIGAYPMGRDKEGNMTYMNVATPTFDIFKNFGSPFATAVGMATPALKMPLEQLYGHSLDPEFDDVDFDDVKGSRQDNLSRITPLTALLRKIQKSNDNPDKIDDPLVEPFGEFLNGKRWDEVITSFATGLGFYENNPKRQQGEEMRQNFEKAKKKKRAAAEDDR